jgi:hypothetical protein
MRNQDGHQIINDNGELKPQLAEESATEMQQRILQASP